MQGKKGRALSHIELTEKQKRMLDDDSYFDVTPEEVKVFLHRLKAMQYPYECIVSMRRKYDAWIDDREKRCMARCGISYDEHRIEKQFNSSFLIDGYTEMEWRLLFDDNYCPSLSIISKGIAAFQRRGKYAEAEVIRERYQATFDELAERRRQAFLEKINLPSDFPCEEADLRAKRADGMPIGEWRALNDPNYTPQKQYLTELMDRFGQRGDLDSLSRLYQKYGHIIDEANEEPELTMEEAEKVFDKLFAQNDTKWRSNNES